MKKTVLRSFVKSIGLNLLGGIVGLLPFIFLEDDALITWGIILLIIAFASLLIQLVVALVYLANPEKKESGQGMLMSVGLFLLVGLAVCGPMWFG